MMPLYLTEAEVNALVSMADAVTAIEGAFAALGSGQADNVPRMRSKAPGVILHSMSATAGYLGLAGWKNYCTTKQGAKFFVGLHRAETGELAVLMEADRLGQLRTGAVTAVAVRYLAEAAADEVGLFGSGYQAETQLEAIAAVRSLRKALVYSRDADRRREFARRMSTRLQIEVQPVEQPADAVRSLPIVVTATSSRMPVFDGREVMDGALVCAVGSNWLNRAEIDADLVARAGRVVCDSVAACRHEAGDLALAAAAGKFDWIRASELGEIVAGKQPHPHSAGGITIFKSVGLALEDVALGAVVLERAASLPIGRSME